MRFFFHLCRIVTASLLPIVSSVAASPTDFSSPTGALRQYVEHGELAGAVVLVAKDGQITQFDAIGDADVSGRRTMQKDSLFWVASMTKPITTAAALILVDQGKIGLDDPVKKFLPEFGDLWLVTEKSDARMVLSRPARPITLRDLLTHQHGLAELPPPSPGTPLAEVVSSIERCPLQFEPGSQWKYGNSGMSVVGRIVEIVSGQALPDFLESQLFLPLGMKDTTFFPNAEQLARLAKSYKRPKGSTKLVEVRLLLNGDIAKGSQTVAPGGGLFSTASDMFRFYQMLLNGGEFNGRRYLSEHIVREMVSPQTGSLKAGFNEGMAWGLGLGIVTQPQGWTECLPAGAWGHDGAFGTSVMAIPSRKLLLIMMIQHGGLNPYTDGLRFRRDFHRAVMGVVAHPAS